MQPDDFQMYAARRAIVAGSMHAELARALGEEIPQVEFRGSTLEGITDGDLVWADTYIGFKRPPLPAMGNVRWVHCTGAGVDAWLYPVELPREILLTRTSESFGPMIAECALARALAFTQQIIQLAAAQRERRWEHRDVRFIRGTRALVVGTGDVGTHIARLFRALGATVAGVSRSERADRSVFGEAHGIDDLAALVGAADWLVLALPLTRETDGLITRDVLMRCRGAVLINAGRGAVVAEAAIPQALNAGALRGAALDVFTVEPLPASSPLWSDERVMISPHLSGPTTVTGAVAGFVESYRALRDGKRPPHGVDRAKQY
jgi:D-2-hydroxyacid dehydrogenase (NADP+)